MVAQLSASLLCYRQQRNSAGSGPLGIVRYVPRARFMMAITVGQILSLSAPELA